MRISLLNPLKQFYGHQRMLEELLECLNNRQHTTLNFVVAFAKVGPLLRLNESLTAFRKRRGTANAIFGIDFRGTSKEALEFAMNSFDSTFVTHTRANSTFHPKLYLFAGKEHATLYYGSHNLTVGGTETNFEGGAKVELDLSEKEDFRVYQDALTIWRDLLPDACDMTLELTSKLLKTLLSTGLVCDEAEMPRSEGKQGGASLGEKAAGKPAEGFPFPSAAPAPPTAIPKSVCKKSLQVKAKPPAKGLGVLDFAEALAIQVVPHHNGEIFLSKIAVNQNPSFFKYPFKGRTKPKKDENVAYPQREPDPVVNVTIRDGSGKVVYQRDQYPLNMVYYERKSEIRITFSPDLKKETHDMAIMIMRLSDFVDYDIEVVNPGGKYYDVWLAKLNQPLPSGGSPNVRYIGWI